MHSLSCIHDSRNDNYVLYHSALLVFVLTIIIPVNLHLTKLSAPVTGILFAVGFLSLFMIVRNEKIGMEWLKFIRVEKRSKTSEPLEQVYTYKNSAPKKIQHIHPNSDIHQDPIVLLQSFIDELSMRHKENMDWTTLESFRKLSDRVAKLVEAKSI